MMRWGAGGQSGGKKGDKKRGGGEWENQRC